MEYEKIKQLMDDMGNSKLSSNDIEFPDGIKIKMEKKIETKMVAVQYVSEQENVIIEKTINENKAEIPSLAESVKNGNIVKSPMIGTFYTKPSPTSAPYVEVGTQVKKGDVLCIVEAMKLMNEIECEFTGKIVNIFVKDGETVEYGTPLFEIE